jgi:hypothetical protein
MRQQKQFPCPDCGRTVVTDDAALKVAHEWPECPGFLERLAAAGGTSVRTVDVLDTSTIPRRERP